VNVNEFFLRLQDTALGRTISESAIVFPWIESIHVLAITFVVGSIAIVDLKLLGLASRNDTISRMTREVVPWTVAAFGLAAVTGSLLFVSAAARYWDNGFFRAKLLLLLAAGLNMLVFHFVTGRDTAKWDAGVQPPPAARLAGGLSLAFWVLIVVCGRWVGFTL